MPKYIKVKNLNTCRNNVLNSKQKVNCKISYIIDKQNLIILYLPIEFKENLTKNSLWDKEASPIWKKIVLKMYPIDFDKSKKQIILWIRLYFYLKDNTTATT